MLSPLLQPAHLLATVSRYLDGVYPNVFAGHEPGWLAVRCGLALLLVVLLMRQLWRRALILPLLIMVGIEAGLALIVSHFYSSAVVGLFAKLAMMP